MAKSAAPVFEHLQSYLDAALRPARDQTDLNSNSIEGNTQSSGGKADFAAAFRQERQMNAALDKSSRTKPSVAGDLKPPKRAPAL
jgi:hypothetical protein